MVADFNKTSTPIYSRPHSLDRNINKTGIWLEIAVNEPIML